MVEQKKEFDENAKELKSAEARLAVVEETLKQNGTTATATTAVSVGSSEKVRIMVAFGDRFSKRTGKEINPPTERVFTFGEWQLFKKNHKLLGYTITGVVNDPYSDAAALVEVPQD